MFKGFAFRTTKSAKDSLAYLETTKGTNVQRMNTKTLALTLLGRAGLLFLFNVSLAPHVAPKAVGVVGNVDETKGNGRCEERFILAPAYGLLVPKARDDAEERRSKA